MASSSAGAEPGRVRDRSSRGGLEAVGAGMEKRRASKVGPRRATVNRIVASGESSDAVSGRTISRRFLRIAFFAMVRLVEAA